MRILPDITFGNIVTLVIVILGFVVTWTRQDMRIVWLERWVREHQSATKIMESDISELKLDMAKHIAKGEED